MIFQMKEKSHYLCPILDSILTEEPREIIIWMVAYKINWDGRAALNALCEHYTNVSLIEVIHSCFVMVPMLLQSALIEWHQIVHYISIL